ncbi:uncharacterized protein LOC113008624 isoform X1 [Astatotilapia calliptera]|uniref:uncharacterized protein LOC113008624 isoform X1 n=1 Tax=Astatotilapia calliptera TaxID=8154 RepID=UPI000E3FC0CA|nr:uncharacterized protein LOC113008624 isoform X1 [Astatotilapia calliptera]XP_026001940.1 uncharacterized protein LOC113008624 isoform X1 [Astatotilapia calliptera]
MFYGKSHCHQAFTHHNKMGEIKSNEAHSYVLSFGFFLQRKRQVAPETTLEPDKISDKLKNMQHDCTPAEAAPPQEDCLETEGRELEVQPPPNSSEDPVQVICPRAGQPECPEDKTTDIPSTHKEGGESSHQVKNTTENGEPSDLSWDTLIMEFLEQEHVWEQVVDIVAKHLNDGKITENKIQTVDHFGFPNTANTCYMNSCLQSLLNTDEFIRDISHQETLWRAVPEAQLLRCATSTFYFLQKAEEQRYLTPEMSVYPFLFTEGSLTSGTVIIQEIMALKNIA